MTFSAMSATLCAGIKKPFSLSFMTSGTPSTALATTGSPAAIAWGITRGSPDMMVGSRLAIERVGSPFSGDGYTVTSLRHTYDLCDGHRTHFEAVRSFVEAPS